MSTDTESPSAASGQTPTSSEGPTDTSRPRPGIASLWASATGKIAVAVAVLAVVALVAWFVMRNGGGTPPAASCDSTATSGLVSFKDPGAGYQLSYPAAWVDASCDSGKTTSTDKTAESSHVFRITDADAFSIRTFRLEHKVSAKNLEDMRAVTDAILSTPEANLTVVDVRKVTIGGLPAVRYLYYFPYGNQRGTHAHYFVFDGNTMHTMVFQVVPAEKFADYAKQFDQVLNSFKPLKP